IQFHHAVLLRCVDHIAEHRRAMLAANSLRELLDEAMTVEDIVAQDQRDTVVLDEVTPDNEGVGQPARIFLGRVGEGEPELRAITQESLEQRQVVWSANY